MSSQATSLTDFSFYFMAASAVSGLSEVAQEDVRTLIAGLVLRMQIVDPKKPSMTLEDITELYLVQHYPSDRVHGIACFKVEPATKAGEKSVIKFFGISLLNSDEIEGSDVDTASEFGLRGKLENIRARLEVSSRSYLEDCTLAKVKNLSTVKI